MTFKMLSTGSTQIGNVEFQWGVRTYVMGVLNTTPDSFSGDGVGNDIDLTVRKALQFQHDGADIIDVGGESTRPPSIYKGAGPVTTKEEISRVVPAVKALAKVLDIPISVDTYKAVVARLAIAAGASMVNDQWALNRDPEMTQVIVESNVPVVLMHNQEGVTYDNLIKDVISDLQRDIDKAVRSGICFDNLIVDPGIGFGKTPDHNLELIRCLDELQVLGRPILVGTSRKSTIGYVLDLPVDQRIEGTAATVAFSIAAGVDIVRVHDVKEMVKVSRMSDAIARGWEKS